MRNLISYIKLHGHQAYPAPNEANKIEIVKQLDDGSKLVLRLHASFKAVMPWLGY